VVDVDVEETTVAKKLFVLVWAEVDWSLTYLEEGPKKGVRNTQ
jgi:hypothetical protein